MNVIAVAALVGGLLLAAHGYGWVLVVALVVALVIASGNRSATGHAHGGNRRTRARHEAGHVVAARAVGGTVRSAHLTSSGGLVRTRNLPNAKAAVVFFLAGEYAAGASNECSGDRSDAQAALNEYPAHQRAQVLRDAQAQARRIVSSNRNEIEQVAQRLDQRGHL